MEIQIKSLAYEIMVVALWNRIPQERDGDVGRRVLDNFSDVAHGFEVWNRKSMRLSL